MCYRCHWLCVAFERCLRRNSGIRRVRNVGVPSKYVHILNCHGKSFQLKIASVVSTLRMSWFGEIYYRKVVPLPSGPSARAVRTSGRPDVRMFETLSSRNTFSSRGCQLQHISFIRFILFRTNHSSSSRLRMRSHLQHFSTSKIRSRDTFEQRWDLRRIVISADFLEMLYAFVTCFRAVEISGAYPFINN